LRVTDHSITVEPEHLPDKTEEKQAGPVFSAESLAFWKAAAK